MILSYDDLLKIVLHLMWPAFRGKQQKVHISISTASQKQTQLSRVFLTSIIKCLEFCGRQGIARRGHRDDSTSESPNQGNFKALIDLRIDAGDIALNQHLKTCASMPHTF